MKRIETVGGFQPWPFYHAAEKVYWYARIFIDRTCVTTGEHSCRMLKKT